MQSRSTVWYKVATLFLVLALLVPVLAACGGDNGEKTPTPSVTAPVAITPAATTPAATTPVATTPAATVSKGPVKIGALVSWSGQVGVSGILADRSIKVVNYQVEKMGGILGGRPLEIVKCDDKSQLSGTIACWTKLVDQEKVSAIVFGGAIDAFLVEGYDLAEKYKMPFFSFTPIGDTTQKPYSVTCTFNLLDITKYIADYVLNDLKPKTAAILSDDTEAYRGYADYLKERMQKAGVDVVYTESIPVSTTDFSSYVTKAKYENPDVLLQGFSNEGAYAVIFNEISELGGWGNMKCVNYCPSSTGASAIKRPAAVGTYHWIMRMPGMDNPGSRKYKQDWKDILGGAPNPLDDYFYYTLWTAISAIEQAGSDNPQKVAEVMRSGHLQWESPSGLITIFPDGDTHLRGFIVQVNDKHELALVKDLSLSQ